MRKRMLRIPAPHSKCPLALGKVYNLQPRPFAPSQGKITVTAIRRERLDELSDADARKEGYAGRAGALDAYKRAHGLPKPDEEVWAVSFVCGDESDFVRQDEPVYLRRGGGYTSIRDELEAGEVLTPAGAAEHARIMALAARTQPVRRKIDAVESEVQTLREQMVSMKSRNRARLIERELGKLRSELPISELARVAS